MCTPTIRMPPDGVDIRLATNVGIKVPCPNCEVGVTYPYIHGLHPDLNPIKYTLVSPNPIWPINRVSGGDIYINQHYRQPLLTCHTSYKVLVNYLI
mgnify:CR=1 FL=1